MADQVCGLEKASEVVDYIDRSRVGVMGWSYGGYLSLMAVAQYPDIFKVHHDRVYIMIGCTS